MGLHESAAILKYLAHSRNVSESWYPRAMTIQAIRQRALIDQSLDWQHCWLRQGAGIGVFRQIFAEAVLGRKFDEASLKMNVAYLKASLRQMENWLKESEYLCGAERSIADLQAAQEIEQLRLTDQLPLVEEKFPNVYRWYLDQVEDIEVRKTCLHVRQMEMDIKKGVPMEEILNTYNCRF